MDFMQYCLVVLKDVRSDYIPTSRRCEFSFFSPSGQSRVLLGIHIFASLKSLISDLIFIFSMNIKIKLLMIRSLVNLIFSFENCFHIYCSFG